MRLHDLFEYHARTRPDHPCMVDGERRLTYRETAGEADRLVNALRTAGLHPGDRFAYLSRNSADMVIAFLAGSKSGTVALPLNWRLAPVEWRRILEQGGARLIIAQSEFATAFDQSRPATLGSFYSIGDATSGWNDYRAWLAAQPAQTQSTTTGDDVPLYQMYTSGTTGEPKGAVLPQRSVMSNAMQAMVVFERRMSQNDRALIVMPMFHAGASSFVIGTLTAGATMVIHREFSAKALVHELSSGITIVNLVPAMILMALQLPDVAQHDFRRLHTIIYGASPIAEETLRRALKVFGCQFYQGFGQTESSACLTFLTHQDHERALRDKPELLLSVGRPLAGTEIRIVDEQDRDIAAGEVGEIIARGPQLMQGYWNKPAETAAALKDGWLHTGDAGRLDADGYLYVCDRIKDMIISGGENIYPREVENVLFEHPAVADAAVIGVPDAQYGETVMAVVVRRTGMELSADEVVAHCRRQLGGYKLPRRVKFAASLPRNPSGKVLKNELRAPYWHGRSRNVG
ncbi:MAG: class I adenylate-forming enzyme family protein [Steroidobacteraceae bacterium]